MRLNGQTFRVVAEIDGERYEVGAISGVEAEKITAWTGYNVREWESRLVDYGDPLAARGVLALTGFRKGENVRFTGIDVEDIDSIDCNFVDAQGRVLTIKLDEQNEPVRVDGKPVLLLDGVEQEPVPTVPARTPLTD